MNPSSPDLPAEQADATTGLPRFTAALSDLGQLTRSGQAGKLCGIVALALLPDPHYFRQSADSIFRLRLAITRQLQDLLRPQDLLYCISQREWLLILPDLISPAAVTLAMLRLRDNLLPLPEHLGYSGYQPGLALGSAQWPDDGNDPLHLVQSARIARHLAEDHDGILAYRPEMDVVGEDEQQLLDELRQAIHEQQALRLFLQPQVDLRSNACRGAELLLRWQRRSGEWISPERVLEAVDRLGERPAFLRWLLNRTAQMQNRLRLAGINIPLSINLAAHNLLDGELPDLIEQILAIHDVPRSSIVLELTETGMIAESLHVAEVLERLRRLGLRLSIDDFGTGYAGMSYLQRLPVQEVKIDQMFVRQARKSPRAREIVTSIIQLARRLSLEIVAEGVEDAETAALLNELGCQTGQGFWYAPPLPDDEFITWWQARQGG
jgi:EAL domain-containing protein (putative c-di-GMP-specific phosphodiesterase class I)